MCEKVRKELGLTEIVELIHNDEETLDKATSIIENAAKKKETLIFEAMSIPLLEKRKFTTTFDCVVPKDKTKKELFTFILSKDNITDKQRDCLEDRGIIYYELKPNDVLLHDAPEAYYWNDIISTPSECLYLYPHSPNKPNNHDHYGFWCYDPEASGKIHEMLLDIVTKIKNKKLPVTLPPVEDIVNWNYYKKNKEKLSNIGKYIITSGTLMDAHSYKEFFSPHSELWYRNEIHLDLLDIKI